MGRLTDRKRKQIVADYLETQSVNAAARRSGVSWDTAKRVLDESGDIAQKLEEKKAQNTEDILAYLDSQRQTVCEIIGKGLAVLNDPEKLREATPAQITTAIGTLIDKWTQLGSRADGGAGGVVLMPAVLPEEAGSGEGAEET